MTRLMVTGFEAFGGRDFNPSEAIVGRLMTRPPTADFLGVVLPVEYLAAPVIALDAYDRFRPDVVVLIGLAAASRGVRLERCAQNRTTSTQADAAGAVPADAAIVGNGPDLRTTRLDVDALRERLAARLPIVEVSHDAGGYVCNAVYYQVLHALDVAGAATPALFVHIPWMHAPVSAADFLESPLDAHERVARIVLAAVVDQVAGVALA